MVNELLKLSAQDATKTLETVANGEVSTTAMSFADRLTYCLEKALIGLLIVFGVLAIIWLVLAVFKVVFYTIPESKKNGNANEKQKVEEAVAPVATSVTSNASFSSDDEIVAAIIAAITAMRAEDGNDSPSGFRVVSFKRKGKARPWNY